MINDLLNSTLVVVHCALIPVRMSNQKIINNIKNNDQINITKYRIASIIDKAFNLTIRQISVIHQFLR